MSKNAKRGLSLVGIVVIAALVFWWLRVPTDMANTTSVSGGPPEPDAPSSVAVTKSSSVTPATSSSKRGGDVTTPSAPLEQQPPDTHESPTQARAPTSEVPAAFDAESRYLDTTGLGIDLVNGPGVLSAGDLDFQMDALAAQASGEPLASDLTKLLSDVANVTAKSAAGVDVRRVVCGIRICLGSATSASNEELRTWSNAFMSKQMAFGNSAVGLIGNRPDGTFEFRTVFANDPAGKHVAPGN